MKFLHCTYIWGSVFTFEVIDKSNRMHDFSVFFRTYHIPCLSCKEAQQLVFDHFWFEFLSDELFASHVSFVDQFSFSAWFSYQIVENVCCYVCLFSIFTFAEINLGLLTQPYCKGLHEKWEIDLLRLFHIKWNFCFQWNVEFVMLLTFMKCQPFM